MELQYVKVGTYHKERKNECPHNPACSCFVKNCGSCGWHPKVMKSRFEKLFFGKEAKV